MPRGAPGADAPQSSHPRGREAGQVPVSRPGGPNTCETGREQDCSGEGPRSDPSCTWAASRGSPSAWGAGPPGRRFSDTSSALGRHHPGGAGGFRSEGAHFGAHYKRLRTLEGTFKSHFPQGAFLDCPDRDGPNLLSSCVPTPVSSCLRVVATRGVVSPSIMLVLGLLVNLWGPHGPAARRRRTHSPDL